MSQALSLFRLQQVDSAIDRIRIRIQEIQEIVTDNMDLNDLRTQVQTHTIKKQNAEASLFQVENSVRTQKIKIEQTESNLYSGKVINPKELQDLQTDLASLRKYLVTLEENQLSAMILLEDAESEHQIIETRFSKYQQEWKEKNFTLCNEEVSLNKELDILIVERQAITSSLPLENLNHYSQLYKQRRGIAVTGIIDNACAACGSILSPGQQQLIHSSDQIVHCPSCGRILFGN
jgi:uncharacterized protein